MTFSTLAVMLGPFNAGDGSSMLYPRLVHGWYASLSFAWFGNEFHPKLRISPVDQNSAYPVLFPAPTCFWAPQGRRLSGQIQAKQAKNRVRTPKTASKNPPFRLRSALLHVSSSIRCLLGLQRMHFRIGYFLVRYGSSQPLIVQDIADNRKVRLCFFRSRSIPDAPRC